MRPNPTRTTSPFAPNHTILIANITNFLRTGMKWNTLHKNTLQQDSSLTNSGQIHAHGPRRARVFRAVRLLDLTVDARVSGRALAAVALRTGQVRSGQGCEVSRGHLRRDRAERRTLKRVRGQENWRQMRNWNMDVSFTLLPPKVGEHIPE